MSTHSKTKPVTIHTFQKKKDRGEKIVSLTCYDYSMAKLLDGGDVDFLLVGDSLAMTMLGHPDTLSVTVDEMLHHVKAVSRGAQRALVVADMPFMSYHVDKVSALRNAGRFIQEGRAAAVKLEGATPHVLSVVEDLTGMGIPVMGHLGFTPQAVNTLGGFRVQGKSVAQAKKLLEEAKRLEEAGVFSIVLEMVPVEVANLVSQQVRVPTIGIGAGRGCDGQILVIDDMLGRYPDLKPRFVRPYLQAGDLFRDAIEAYARDVREGRFPDDETEAFHFETDQISELHLAMVGSDAPVASDSR